MKSQDQLRRIGFRHWFERRVREDGSRTEFLKRTQLSKGRVTQLLDQEATFGEGAALTIERAYDLEEGFFLTLGKRLEEVENQSFDAENNSRVARTPANERHATDVNPNTKTRDRDEIWVLPLLTLGRADLAREPNMSEEVVRLGTIDVLPRLDSKPDFSQDKAMVLPHDVNGTRAQKGDIAVFRPIASGERPEPTKKPILVKSPSGTYHLVSYDAMAMAPLEAVAFCFYFYEP